MVKFQMQAVKKGRRSGWLGVPVALSLLTCGFLAAQSVAQATSPLLTSPRALPGSPLVQGPLFPGTSMNPYASTDPRLNAVRPVLELLVTLRQLTDPALMLTSSQQERLGSLLDTLQAIPLLEISDADRLSAELEAELSVSQRKQLERARAAQDTRLRALLTRARLAAPDGPPQLARLAYSQWLGTETVTALLTTPDRATVTRLVRAAALRTEAALKL